MNLSSSTTRFQQVAAVALIFAGLLHLLIAPIHWQHAPAHGLFFVLSGMAELAWAMVFIRQPSLKLSTGGLVMAVALIILWGLCRVLPAPFGHGPEEVDASGLACKITETVGALALAAAIFQSHLARSSRLAAARGLFGVALVSLVVAGLSYGLARASEPLFPTLLASPDEDHHDLAEAEEGHEHAEESWTASTPVPASTVEERFGLRVTLVAVTANGGLIDFRFKVLDQEKARAVLENHDQMPQLVAEDTGDVLAPPGGMHHKLSLIPGRVYYMFYPNRQNTIKPGTPVSIVIGDARLEHLIAQ